MAVAMHKGGVDYDDVNARQLIQNTGRHALIMRMLESWDQRSNSPRRSNTTRRMAALGWLEAGAINMDA